MCSAGDREAAEGAGTCWIATPADGGVPRLLLMTKFGVEEITTLEHLQLRLELVAPGPPPENDTARAEGCCGSSKGLATCRRPRQLPAGGGRHRVCGADSTAWENRGPAPVPGLGRYDSQKRSVTTVR